MKKYVKAEMIAKNLPSGSYAAGCPANANWQSMCAVFNTHKLCSDCERSR